MIASHLQGRHIILLVMVLLVHKRSSPKTDASLKAATAEQHRKALQLATIIDDTISGEDIGEEPLAPSEDSIKQPAFIVLNDDDDNAADGYGEVEGDDGAVSQLHRRAAYSDISLIGSDHFEHSARQTDDREKFRANSAIDQIKTTTTNDEYEISVSDQFVNVDNDALFRCQIPGQWRDLYQLVAWLEDGQQLPEFGQMPSQGQPSSRSLVLPDGQLYVQHVQLMDANKSYRCQVRNVLTGQLSMSPLSGRLFVTDAGARGGIQPRIVDSPEAITLAKLNEQILLSCLAQGSPRPTMRWFKQLAHNKDWNELVPTGSDQKQQLLPLLNNNNSSGELSKSGTQLKYSIQADGNLLIIKSLQQSDNRAKFRCLANNTFGMDHADTEMRIELYPQSKLVEIEPKVEYINNNGELQQRLSQQQDLPAGRVPAPAKSMLFNCTIRASNLPLVAIEWLKDGKLLASISLPQYSQLAGPEKSPIDFQLSNGSSSQIVSMFDDLNQELTLIERFTAVDEFGQTDEFGRDNRGPPAVEESSSWYQQKEGIENVVIRPTSLAKLDQLGEADEPEREPSSAHRLSQRLRFAASAKDRTALLYQLRFGQLRRSDRGSYECRARNTRKSLRATGQLLLKDTPPLFVETFTNQLINTESIQSAQASLKCIASGSPLPEISWRLSGFQIPESSRYRVGDYVTRDALIVSFVNITNVQAEDGGLYECSATNDVGQLRHSGWLNVTGGPYVRPMPNVSAVAGGSMSIMCPVGGWPIDQISWFQNSSKLPMNHRQKLFPNGTLLISDLDEITDSGQYSCQAKWSANADLIGSNSLHVSIKVPPLLEPLSFAKSLHRGQRYNIMCTVVRGDLPVNIRWFKDNRLLNTYSQQELVQQSATEQQDLQQQEADNRNNIAIKQLDPYSSTLTFASLQPHHRGLYTCEATNEAGRANQSSQLVIHVPPSWRIEPKDLSVTVDKTAVIDCQADAFPAARIEWRLSQGCYSSYDRRRGRRDFMHPMIPLSDQPTTKAGTIINIILLTLPMSRSTDLYREPPTEFKPITSSLYMRVFENGSLIIYNTQRSDAGYYLCQANNGVGPGLSRVLKLTVHVAAHFKTKIRTELVKRGQTVKLKCESIGDPPIEINWLKDKMPFYVGDGGPPRYTLTRTPLQDGLLSELQISETDRSDSALFTCISQNQFGNDDTNIQLIVQSAPEPPLDIRIHEYEARSVKISWLPGHSGNLPILKYIIQYAQTSASPSDLSSSENSLMLLDSSLIQQQSSRSLQKSPLNLQYSNVSVSGNETSLLLSNLNPLTEYQFFMYAVNAIGSARAPTNNEPIKFRTDDEAPSGPPQFVKAHPVSSHSIKVRWRAPERRGLHYGSISGYYVGYKLLRSHQAVPSSASATSTDTFVYKTVELPIVSNSGDKTNRSMFVKQQQEMDCLLTGLRRAHKYLISIQAFNGRGAGPASEAVVAETWRIDVPNPPILRMLLRTTHSIHLAWRLPGSNSATTGGGQLETTRTDRERTSLSQTATSLHRNKSPRSSGSASDLDPEHEAELAQSNEPILGFVLTRTQLTTPSAIGDSDHKQSAADEGQQQPQPVVEMRLPSDHLSQIVDNLTCGTKYQFTMVALNSVGSSEPSDPLTVRTEGSTPVAPDKSSLLVMNSSSLLINLAAWHNGQCAMKSFEVMYKPSRFKKWTPINLNSDQQPSLSQQTHIDSFVSPNQLVQRSTASASQQPTQSAFILGGNSTIVLENLSSDLNYDLRILATNEAGSTEALYTFNTNNNAALYRSQLDLAGSNGGDFQLTDASLAGFFSPSNPSIPWLVFLIFLTLTLTTGCILLSKRRHFKSSACSLSLSTASRSNQSSSNYYTSSGATTTATTTTSTNPTHQPQQMNGANTLQKLHLTNERGGSGQLEQLSRSHIHLGDVYGHHQLLDKSNYTFLSDQQQPSSNQRASSPQNTDLGSLLNGGSEAEMCLGASALNIANQQQQMAASSNTNDQQAAGSKSAQQATTYYVTPMQLMLSTKQAALSSLAGKSSTLPSICHQQQQQFPQASVSSQQQLVDNLMAASLIQQQLTNEADYIAMNNHNHDSTVAALLEQQMQQQVYATVKRGCPRPPRLCDYGIYQCPAANQPDHQVQCCSNSAIQQSVEQQQPQQVCYHLDQACSFGRPRQPQSQPQPQPQQQQPQPQPQQPHSSSDYQQLRPMS